MCTSLMDQKRLDMNAYVWMFESNLDLDENPNMWTYGPDEWILCPKPKLRIDDAKWDGKKKPSLWIKISINPKVKKSTSNSPQARGMKRVRKHYAVYNHPPVYYHYSNLYKSLFFLNYSHWPISSGTRKITLNL